MKKYHVYADVYDDHWKVEANGMFVAADGTLCFYRGDIVMCQGMANPQGEITHAFAPKTYLRAELIEP